MASRRSVSYRVVDPVRDLNGHHPQPDGAPVARHAPLISPTPPQPMQQQPSLVGAATPMPRQPALPPRSINARKISPAPLPPRPKVRRGAPDVMASTQPEAFTAEHKTSIVTAEEQVLVDELRARVADTLRDDQRAERLGDDSALHRFICARQGSVTDAEEMFRQRLEWHREVRATACVPSISTRRAPS